MVQVKGSGEGEKDRPGGARGAGRVGAAARSDVFLSLVQVAGVLIVVVGVAAWSVPAAMVLLGLVMVGAAEMWMRGDRHGTTD